MTKIILACLMAAGSLHLVAQERTANDSIPLEMRKQAFIYNMGKKYNDPSISRMALYNLIASNPGSTPLMDSLALSYFEYQQYASAALISQDVLALNPNDLFATEIAAISFENLGVSGRAVEYYEKLYLEDNNVATLYKISFLQYQMKRYEEALNNADIVVNSDQGDELKLLFSLGNNKSQEIGIKAGAVRLKGMIEEAKGNKEKAREYYQQALEMEPEFAVVKQQLEKLDQ